MRRLRPSLTVCAGTVGLLPVVVTAADIGTAFTYQGRLVKDGTPVTSDPPHCDITFGLWDQNAPGGNQVGASPQAVNDVAVIDGLFTVSIDFGAGAMNGTARWLEITVQCPGDAMPTTLAPRQELQPTPNAIRAWEGVGPPNALEVDTATANVGIGTASPTQKLDVAGNLRASGTLQSGNSVTIDGAAAPQTITASDELLVNVGAAGRVLRILAGDDAAALPITIPNIIGGLSINTVDPNVSGATIAGGGSTGEPNIVLGSWGTIGGGDGNTAGPGVNVTVAGGFDNTASGAGSTVGGGSENTASNGSSNTIGGGQANTIFFGGWSVIGGGSTNYTSGLSSVIGGGVGNVVEAGWSTICGGE